MKYFVPLSDDQLFSERGLKRYRLVPYEPDLHFSAVRKRSARRGSRPVTGRVRHAGVSA